MKNIKNQLPPHTSVIIPVLESYEIVRRQLVYLYQIWPQNLELILVDDGSQPSIISKLKSIQTTSSTKEQEDETYNWCHFNGLNFSIIETHDETRWSQPRAHNIGAKHANGRFLLFTDIDHILTIQALKYAASNNQDKVFFQRKYAILDENGILKRDPKTLEEYGAKKNSENQLDVHPNSFIIKKSIFDALGGYDEKFCGQYGGDVIDFNNRYNSQASQGKCSNPIIGPEIYVFPNPAKDEKKLFHTIKREKKRSQKDKQLISVIMPTYNRRHTLPKAILSVLSQTYRNLELVVINDGGVCVKDIISKFSDDRIKLFTLKHGGKSRALNFGLNQSKGYYIAYLDDDDEFYPYHLETLMKAANIYSNTDFLYTIAEKVNRYEDQDIAYETKEIKYCQKVSSEMLMFDNFIPNLTVLHTKKIIHNIGLYDENLDILEDWDFYRRLSTLYPPKFINKVTCKYYRNHYRNIEGKHQMTGTYYEQPLNFIKNKLRILKKPYKLPSKITKYIYIINAEQSLSYIFNNILKLANKENFIFIILLNRSIERHDVDILKEFIKHKILVYWEENAKNVEDILETILLKFKIAKYIFINDVNDIFKHGFSQHEKNNFGKLTSGYLLNANITPSSKSNFSSCEMIDNKLVVGVLTEDYRAARYHLRIGSPLKLLARSNLIEIKNIIKDNMLNIPELNSLHILIIQKNIPLYLSFNELRKIIQNQKLKIVYEIDDNLTEHYPDHVGYRKFEANKNHIIEYLKNADIITVSTEELKNQLKKYSSKIAVLPNYIDPEIWQSEFKLNKQSQTLKVLFSGSLTHQVDIKHIISPLSKILDEYKDKIEVIFWGNYDKNLLKYSNVKLIDKYLSDYNEYAQLLSKMNFDIGLIPLEHNDFNKAKSNIKWLEYSICGAASICSNIKPYSGSINNYIDGILVNNNHIDWYNAIKILIENDTLRNKISLNAYNNVTNKFNINKHYLKWHKTYNSTFNSHIECTRDIMHQKYLKNINIVLLYDFYGWAWYHRAIAIQKHVNNSNIYIEVDNRINSHKYLDYDFIVYFGPYHLSKLASIHPDKRIIGSANPFEVKYLERLISDKIAYSGLVNSAWQYNFLSSVDNLYYLPNGVDIDLFFPTDAPPDGFSACWVGNPKAFNDKGLEIIKAGTSMAGVKLNISSIHTKTDLQQSLSHTELRDQIYRKSSFYVCMSLFEGTPNPGLEALACGLPVISTPVGNLQDIIVDGYNGYLIERTPEALRDAIQKLKSKDWRELSHNARQSVVNGWSWADQAKKYEQMFLELWERRKAEGKERLPEMTDVEVRDQRILLTGLDNFFHLKQNYKEIEKENLGCEWAHTHCPLPIKKAVNQNNIVKKSIKQSHSAPLSNNHKVLFICHDFPPYRMAGAQLYAKNLAQEINRQGLAEVEILYPEFRDQNTDVYTIMDGKYEDLKVFELCKNHFTEPEKVYNPTIFNIIKSFLQKHRYQVIHFHGLGQLSLAPIFAAHDLGIKTVMTLHDYWFLCDRWHMIRKDQGICTGPENISKCVSCFIKDNELKGHDIEANVEKYKNFRSGIVKKAFEKIDMFFSPSKYLQKVFHNYGFENIKHMPLGFVPPKNYSKKKRKDDIIIFGYAGQIIERKGVNLLIEAFKKITLSSTELHIWGPINEKNKYQKQLEKITETDKRIKLFGSYKHDEMDKVFNSFDIT
ncbi:MAG: glycosyltransferase, partial [bacterium]